MEDNNFTKKITKKKKTQKRTCVYCLKPIKKFAKWKDNPNRKVHRSCWLKHREWEWRHFDYFFTEKVAQKTASFEGSKSVSVNCPNPELPSSSLTTSGDPNRFNSPISAVVK